MNYFKCTFRVVGYFYSMSWYDLPTDNKDRILEILASEGWAVSEIYDIKNQ